MTSGYAYDDKSQTKHIDMSVINFLNMIIHFLVNDIHKFQEAFLFIFRHKHKRRKHETTQQVIEFSNVKF